MLAQARILIIDDDEDMSYTLARMVEQAGYGSQTAFSLQEGIAAAWAASHDVVFLDVNLPDGSGMSLIPELKKLVDPPEIIIITAFGDAKGAAVALRSDVWDYIPKPARMDDMRLSLQRALEYRAQKRRTKPLAVKRDGIVGSSPQLAACIEQLAVAAGSSGNVLLCGETGTGKEVFARAIHLNSDRSMGPFVVVDCASLPESLVESILFGHERGSFTGAEATRVGLLGQANGGTLFLDEMGELPLGVQRVFLRAIQEHRFRPVGGREQQSSDFRLLAATNRDLDQMAEQGQFRQDLLHRIRALMLELPPLRERRGDIRELFLYQLARTCDHYGIGIKGVAPEVHDLLLDYAWPGNVRELFNVVEGAVSAAFHDQTIFTYHLPTHLRLRLKERQLKPVPAGPTLGKEIEEAEQLLGQLPTLGEVVDTCRRDYLRKLLLLTRGNVNEACRCSGLSRTTLYNYLNKYGLSPQDVRESTKSFMGKSNRVMP